ncbi:SDR family NAD(P)-dependent oxidoreductase [Pseudomonas sp. ADAK13]|uniref:SDR family NAD(P)-dependent oxidoreductase n=1 Tax=Pseudomonas sp. ADAK13 TaxID=2730847 RepID=UPI0014632FB2|nr:SDR family NAD(P)-dependent oxidoreductase [Pseudomonas sp. ADAK13]QJI37067.1 SDR family NAD(P)-dependent oxidoreductase [Pseudomonas sp. ADAK13]
MKKVVLITGGTSGIGLALAEAFLLQGADVVVCARSEESVLRFSQKHPGALALKADITCEPDRRAMLDTIASRFGRLDILVSNAGTYVERDFAAGVDAIHGLEQEVSVNLTAPIALTGDVLSRWHSMEAIVFVTAGYALVSPTKAPTYGAVKAGLRGFAEGLRRQLAPKGTHVLEVLPPAVDTPMNAGKTMPMLPAAKVAAITLKALAARNELALPGQTRFLPLLLRVAPSTIKRMVAGPA